MAVLCRFLCVSQNFELFYDRLGTGMHDDDSSWWRHQMETFSALLAICAGNSPVPGEFPAQRPVTRSFDVFFDLRLNKRLSKQSWGWWFETLSRSLWRHCNDDAMYHEADHLHGANMGPIWGRQDPDGPHAGPMNYLKWPRSSSVRIFWPRPAEGAVVLWTSCHFLLHALVFSVIFRLQAIFGAAIWIRS